MLYSASFLQKMRDLLPGSEYQEFLEAMQESPVTSIRYNSKKKSDKLCYDGLPIPWEPNAHYIEPRPVFTLDPCFHSGAYYVQEASSMLAGEIFRQISSQNPVRRILDLSAAPGGKSTHILDQLKRDQLLVSNEPIGSRFPVLTDNIHRWGRSNVFLTRKFPKQFESLPGFFDLILVDAPCSGEGMMRKDEQAITHWNEQNIRQCFLRQKEILDAALLCLKEGGFLLYSTCTYNREENENIGDFLLESGNLEKVYPDIPDNWGFTHRTGKQSEVWVAYPHKVKGEGFAIQVFKKNSTLKNDKYASKPIKLQPWKSIPSFLTPLQESVYKREDTYYAWPEELEEDMAILLGSIPDAQPGLKLGISKGKDFLPDHALALSVNSSSIFPEKNLHLESALEYLRGATTIPEIEDVKGWCLITYNTLGLGWCKGLGNRINNYYPKPQRIRHL